MTGQEEPRQLSQHHPYAPIHAAFCGVTTGVFISGQQPEASESDACGTEQWEPEHGADLRQPPTDLADAPQEHVTVRPLAGSGSTSSRIHVAKQLRLNSASSRREELTEV